MGQSVVKNSKKIFSQPGSDPSLNNRVTNLEDNVYKITYYEIVSGTSGSLTIPTGATINEGEFGTSGNSILSKINVEDKPTYSSPLTSGNVVVTANLNIDGTWTASGTYTDTQVALVYSVNIKAIDYHNLDNFYVINSEKLISDSVIAGFVPYNGATADVNLAEFGLSAGQINLDTSPSGTAIVGSTRWNNTNGTSETLLKGGSVSLKNGVDLVARVVNNTGIQLTKAAYQVVKISGAQGQRLAVGLAQANNDLNSADTLGLVIETIANNQEGFIMTIGQLEEVNTTGSLQGETWVDGDVLYLSTTTPGAITKVKPNGSTGHIVVLGYVEYAHANHGKIYVKIMNGWELEELHDVYIPSYVSNGVLYRDTSTNLWKTNTIPSVLGYTPANDSNVVHITGTETISGKKTFSPSVTATSALAQGTVISPTLVASANSDVLVGLDVTPTFTNGAFTGVNNIGLRAYIGTSYISFNNAGTSGYNSLDIVNPNTSGLGYAAFIAKGASNRNNYIQIYVPTDTTVNFGVSRGGWAGNISENVSGMFFGTTTNAPLIIGANNTAYLRLFPSTGNITIQNGGTFTDAGYRLDVNGTARIQTNLETPQISGLNTAGANLTISSTNNATKGSVIIASNIGEITYIANSQFRFTNTVLDAASNANGFSINRLTASDVVPNYVINRADTTTGIGGTINTISLITAGVSRMKVLSDGLVNIGNASATNQRQLRIGQDTATIDIGSMPGFPTYAAIYMNQATPSATNYTITSDGSNVYLNTQSTTGFCYITTGNNTRFYFGRSGMASNFAADIIGATTSFSFITPAHTGQTASTNISNFKITGNSKQWNTGNITDQYWNYFTANTAQFVDASTITNSYGLYVESAISGTNATITNNYALGLKGQFIADFDGSGKFFKINDWSNNFNSYGWGIQTHSNQLRLPNTLFIGDINYQIGRFKSIGDPINEYGGSFMPLKDFKAGSQLNTRIFIYGEDATGNVSTGAIVNANQRRFRVNQDTAWVDIGSMPTSTDTGAIYFNQTAPSGGGNSALSGNSSTTALNATSVVNVNTLGITRLRVISPQTTGSYIGFEFTTPTFTGQTASTNTPNLKVVGANKQWLPSTITDQYWNYFTANTAEFLTTASTITNSYGLFVEAATAGTNASITNNYALGTNGNVEFKSNTSTKIRILSGAGVDTYVGSEGTGAAFGSISAHNVVFYRGNSIKLTLQSSDFLFSDAYNISFNTTTGTKIGTSTTQKLGFYNATPIVQPSAVTTTQGIADALSSLGLLESSTIQPLVGLIPDLKGHEVFRGVKFRPNSTTIDTEGGITNNLSGTQGANTVAITNYRTRQITMRFEPSTVTTGNYCCMRTSAALWSVTGGFLFTAEFGISDSNYAVGAHNFWGLTSSIANLAIGTISNLQPSALTNIIAVANDSGDTNLQIMHNDATGTATKIDLGVDFPSNRTAGAVSTTMYHIRLYNAPGSTEVAYIVINKETGAIAEGVITTNLPDASTLLAYQAGRSMGTGGGGVTGGGRFDVKLLGVYNI